MNRLIERIERIFGLAPAPIKPAPMATVGRSTGPALGFSLLELERAGISLERAAELGLRIDPNRPSSFGDNVIQLQQIHGQSEKK
jgi:ribosomal protein L13E